MAVANIFRQDDRYLLIDCKRFLKRNHLIYVDLNYHHTIIIDRISIDFVILWQNSNNKYMTLSAFDKYK